MKYSLAIDFGSVYTSIYKAGSGLVLKEPTLICVKHKDGEYQIVSMGEDAKKMQGKTDENTYIFSPISEGKIKSFEYAEVLINYFLDKVKVNKILKQNAIVCVNLSLDFDEKAEFLKLFSKTKLEKVSLVPSIITAAEISGNSINTPKTIFHVDFGGTTTQLALINMNSIIKGVSLNLGGRNLDISIANMVADKYQTIISLASAQKLKEEISSLYENDTQSYEVLGVDEATGRPKRCLIFTEEIKNIIQPLLNQICLSIETAINSCAPEIAADIISSGITVSGGVTNILGFKKYLTKRLDIDVNVIQDAEDATIFGAGRLLTNPKDLNDIIAKF